MSFRYPFAIVKPGLNVLVAPTPSYTYEAWSWGLNNNGQLGIGNTTWYSSPKQVGSLTDWLSLNSNYNSTRTLKTDGTVWSWGRNNYGQLGVGDTSNRDTPTEVGGNTWLSLGSGRNHSLAVKTNGTLWAWGRNDYGQLGLGFVSSYRNSPVQVGGLTNWLNVSGGNYHSLAVKTDGTLWSWGANSDGQLGLGNRTYYSSPKQVGSLTTWSKVFGLAYSALAIKTDGTLWSWGWGSRGVLGLGNTISYSSPKQVGALTNWSSASYGSTFNVIAVKTDGTLWSWGRNDQGQLGLGNITYYSSPKQIGALTTWLSCAANYAVAFAVRTNGTLWSWGTNNYGQLGLGNRTQYSSPKQVGSLTTWIAVSCGQYSATALKY